MISWKDPRRFTRFSRRICDEYLTLQAAGTVGGVRFLYGPASSLNDPNGVVLLGINPGGEVNLCDRLCTARTGYYSEVWTSSDYRTRVCDFMESAFTLAGATDWRSAWDRCVTSNLIPFRSPSFARLANSRRSRVFSRELWRDIFVEIEPKTIIAFGKPPSAAIYAILKGTGANLKCVRTYKARGAATLLAFDGARGEGRALLVPHYAYGYGVRLQSEVQAMAEDLAPYL